MDRHAICAVCKDSLLLSVAFLNLTPPKPTVQGQGASLLKCTGESWWPGWVSLHTHFVQLSEGISCEEVWACLSIHEINGEWRPLSWRSGHQFDACLVKVWDHKELTIVPKCFRDKELACCPKFRLSTESGACQIILRRTCLTSPLRQNLLHAKSGFFYDIIGIACVVHHVPVDLHIGFSHAQHGFLFHANVTLGKLFLQPYFDLAAL